MYMSFSISLPRLHWLTSEWSAVDQLRAKELFFTRQFEEMVHRQPQQVPIFGIRGGGEEEVGWMCNVNMYGDRP